MAMLRAAKLLGAVSVALVVAAGCAGAGPAPAASATGSSTSAADSPRPTGTAAPTSTAPPLSSTDLPTIEPPDAPPKTPSDNTDPTWLVGTIVKMSSGPCYQLETDDGELYALYGRQGIKLDQGVRVRVRTAPLFLDIYCGQGKQRSLLEAQTVK